MRSYCSTPLLTNFNKLRLSSVSLITLDATGTLLKFRKPPTQFYQEFGERHGIHLKDPEELRRSFISQWKFLNERTPHFGNCWRSWWTEFVVGTFKGCTALKEHPEHEAKLPLVADELINHFSTEKGWDLKPGAKRLLEMLEKHKVTREKQGIPLKVGIISNFDPRLRLILKSLGVLEDFEFLVLSHEIQISKPDPRIFEYAISQGQGIKGLEPRRCLHVGDNCNLDYLGAINSGWVGGVIVEDEDKHEEIKKMSGKEGCNVWKSLDHFCDSLILD